MDEISEPLLTKSIFQIRKERAVNSITRWFLRLKRKRLFIKKRISASITIQKYFRGWKARTQSYLRVLEMEKFPSIYICREQKPFLLNIIKQMIHKYPQLGSYLDISKENFKITQKYCAVRILEPEAANLPQ